MQSPVRGARATMHSGWIHVGSVRVHHTHGGSGTPVLFIHGLGSSGYIEWRYNLEPAAAQHRVFAPDLPGFGRSDKPKARYGIGYFTRFVERYLESRGLRSVAVVGASLGGRVALELGLRHPGLVRRLALVNSLGLGRPNLRMTYGLVSLPGVGEALMNLARDAIQWAPADIIRRVAARYSGASSDPQRTMDDEYVDHLRELHGAQGYQQAYLATVRSLISPRPRWRSRYDVTHRLKELKMPVQLIWGADDPLFPVAHATHAHAMIAGSGLAVIKGAGHTPQAERPEEFNRVLQQFLDA